jgi:hypothetical protein
MTYHTLFHPLLIMVILCVIDHLGISSIQCFFKEQLLQILKLPSNVTNTKLQNQYWARNEMVMTNFIKDVQIPYCSLRHLNSKPNFESIVISISYHYCKKFIKWNVGGGWNSKLWRKCLIIYKPTKFCAHIYESLMACKTLNPCTKTMDWCYLA